MGQLHGKRCLIVGGTGGIGLAAAQRFLDEGASLLLAGLPEPDPQAVLGRLRLDGESEARVRIETVDAAVAEQVEQLFARALNLLGGLDVLYHVAGSSGRRHGDGPLHECSDDGWHATLNANLTSTFLTNRAAVRCFLQQGGPGAILNVASVVAFSPAPRYFDTCAYTAAKGAIISMSRLAAARYAPHGIRVNVLAPALIDTPMAGRAVSDPAIRHYLRTKQPLTAGPGQPEDCSDAAVFLCSDAARFVTGVVLPLDGGWCVSEGQYPGERPA
jgi:NAD(P)-dependent dehydrogenase (short-subunit alcohol dehydrogenase family)